MPTVILLSWILTGDFLSLLHIIKKCVPDWNKQESGHDGLWGLESPAEEKASARLIPALNSVMANAVLVGSSFLSVPQSENSSYERVPADGKLVDC